jgi:hypothetical protein
MILEDATTMSQQSRRTTTTHPLHLFFLMMIIIGFSSLKISLNVSTTIMKDSKEDITLIMASLHTQSNSSVEDATVISWNDSKQQSTIPVDNNHLDQVLPPPIPLFNHSNIPKFMLEYFEWHGKQLQKFHSGEISWTPQRIVNEDSVDNSKSNSSNNSNSNQTINRHHKKEPEILPRFLIMRCIHGDRCGGTSDRLKAFPLFILLAKESDRILFIRWGRDRPFPITEFLQPGLLWNWTVPEPLLQILEEGDEQHSVVEKHRHHRRVYYDGTKFKQLRQSSLDPTIWVVEGNDYSGGASRYHNLIANIVQPAEWRQEDDNYANFYHDLFHESFVPSPAIAMLLLAYIDQDVTNDSLRPGHSLPIRMQPNKYVVAHYRAKYPGEPYRQTWNVSILEQTVLHAVNCATQRGPSDLATVYVATDTALALQAVYNQYPLPTSINHNFHVWTNLHLQPLDDSGVIIQNTTTTTTTTITTAAVPFAADPPHLNFAKLDDPSGFYGIFVDLFIMSYSYCVVYGAGGFGRFGSLVSFHPRCGTAFTNPKGGLQPQCSPCSDDAQ